MGRERNEAEDCSQRIGGPSGARAQGGALRLVPPQSPETVAALRWLLEQAEAGYVVGVAYVAVHKGKTFATHAAGEARRNPAFTCGMLGALAYDMQRQLMEKP